MRVHKMCQTSIKIVDVMALRFCFQNAPYSMLEKTNESCTLSGSVVSIWRVLERRLNFTYVGWWSYYTVTISGRGEVANLKQE